MKWRHLFLGMAIVLSFCSSAVFAKDPYIRDITIVSENGLSFEEPYYDDVRVHGVANSECGLYRLDAHVEIVWDAWDEKCIGAQFELKVSSPIWGNKKILLAKADSIPNSQWCATPNMPVDATIVIKENGQVEVALSYYPRAEYPLGTGQK